MIRKYPNLCKPITLGRVTFRNRMFSTPMGGTDITNDGCIGPKSTAFYELRAKGGAGAVTVSELMVHPETDASHAYHLDERILNSLACATYTADAIRRHGAIPSLELSHSGMYAGTYMTDKDRQKSIAQWSASACTRADGVEVKALTRPMIDEIVQAYGHVAGLAKRAGFEMLMIHGGHGWLINQFLSPMFNRREDEYGGSLENRCRFAIEVLKAVREAVGPGFPIEFRLSGAEFVEEGYDLEEGIRIAQMIEPFVDLLHVTAGTYQRTFGITHPSMFEEHGRNVYLAAEIKKHVKVPVATIGGLNDPAQMEDIIASSKADIVYMGRALLADPFLPRKVTENRDEEIVRCLRCFTCMAERAATSTRRCTVNPLIGREMEGDEIHPAPVKKKVLVAGGGPGGLYAAYTAARRGHQVILCEKGSEVGGILKGEQALPFKHEMYELAGTYKLLAERAGVEIRMNTEVTPEYVERLEKHYGSPNVTEQDVEKVQDIFHPGDNGSTFGGNPVVCAGALSVLKRLDDDFLAEVRAKSDYLFRTLSKAPGVKQVTGMGLMIGVEPEKGSAAELAGRCLERGLLVLTAGQNRLRLLPALNIPDSLLQEGTEILKEVLAD